VFASNYLAGAPLSRYPAGTLAAGDFAAQFANAAAGDFTVVGGSLLKGAAPDGSDIGANYAELAARIDGVVAGAAPAILPPAPPAAQFTASCDGLACTFVDGSTPGSAVITSQSWNFGDGGLGAGTPAEHPFTASGTYNVMLTITDANGLTASVSQQVSVTADNAVHAQFLKTTAKRVTRKDGSSYWRATLQVAAHVLGEAAIPGARLTIGWSGAATQTKTCTANARGICTFKSANLDLDAASITATIVDVAAPAATYDAAANHDKSGAPTSAVTLGRP
jgi:PKD repeat protein